MAERTIRPKGQVLEALKGVVSEPVTTVSLKPRDNGKTVTVRLAEEGPAMTGLFDWQDNREWFGINTHQWLTARIAGEFSKQMAASGYDTNPSRVVNTMLVSHLGRRVWDEAGWYPEAVDNAQEKRSVSNETLGIRFIQGKVPQDVFELVVALGHNVEGFNVDSAIYDKWDFKIAIYVDHRTSNKYENLNTRMGDFLIGNFFESGSVTEDHKQSVYNSIADIIERQKSAFWRGNGGEVSLDEADRIAAGLGAKPDSSRLTRRELMRLILQDADTEATLINIGVDVDNVNDKTIPAPRWERYVKRLYINDAEEGIFEWINRSPDFVPSDIHFMDDYEFYVRSLFGKQNGVVYESKKGKPRGVQRAIEFFGNLDSKTSSGN